jgi:hypothetical protein
VKYVIRALLDADDPRALREDLARRLGQRREKLRFGRFEVRFQRRRLQSPHQSERNEKCRGFYPIERDRRRKIVARKPETTLRAALCLDRDAKGDEPVDIPVDSADGDFKTLR